MSQVRVESSFTDSQKVACFAKIISTIIETGYGEGLDVEYSNRWTNFNNIRQMTELKTAKYTFVGPLTVGAILGKANKSQIDALSKLGLLIGLAFQIQDDILGVFGKEKVVGKSVLGDLREGKNTLLIHKTKEMLSGKKREELARIWGKKNAGNRDLKRVQKLIINSGALFWAENEKAKLVKSAKVYIKSITRDNDLQSSFSELADFVITRDK
ncbi:MAG: DNA topoisomerase I, DNA topoisomerase I [Microgenomates group bacterium GW2011_GWC1_40_35]|nr:MAG: DNA topoisomerase I, DNA topoisomerase I [Microgenomates group bacterium GW2011_GWC1_40_35]